MNKQEAELDFRRAEARHDREAEVEALEDLIILVDDQIEVSTSPMEIARLGREKDGLIEMQNRARPIRWWWLSRKPKAPHQGGLVGRIRDYLFGPGRRAERLAPKGGEKL